MIQEESSQASWANCRSLTRSLLSPQEIAPGKFPTSWPKGNGPMRRTKKLKTSSLDHAPVYYLVGYIRSIWQDASRKVGGGSYEAYVRYGEHGGQLNGRGDHWRSWLVQGGQGHRVLEAESGRISASSGRRPRQTQAKNQIWHTEIETAPEESTTMPPSTVVVETRRSWFPNKTI